MLEQLLGVARGTPWLIQAEHGQEKGIKQSLSHCKTEAMIGLA